MRQRGAGEGLSAAIAGLSGHRQGALVPDDRAAIVVLDEAQPSDLVEHHSLGLAIARGARQRQRLLVMPPRLGVLAHLLVPEADEVDRAGLDAAIVLRPRGREELLKGGQTRLHLADPPQLPGALRQRTKIGAPMWGGFQSARSTRI